ncbi:hypothetical protein MTO96_004407 [Rhipicephalus appendiculatus]
MAGVEREKWSNKIEFILSSVGLSVGLGNVWRFPYVAFENGGGAFMVPYIVLMLLLGRPMYYLELVLGQFASDAQARAFGGFPLAKGEGARVHALYYNVLLGYALLYLIYSFHETLPWTRCDYSDWADSDCYNPMPGIVPCRTVEPRLLRLYGEANYTGPDAHAIHHGSHVVLVPRQAYELLANSCTTATQTAPEQFFYRNVLGLSSGIDDLGSLQPRLAAALVVSWLCVYLCVFKGIKTSGKAVYVTALAPFLILGMLFVRGITLPGAADGIRFYLVPDWSSILRAKVWKNAAEQIFYSLSLAEGMIICFGGFNEFRNRIHEDVLVVALADFHSVGLAFIAYPQALSMIAYPQLWSVAFYAMLFFLAIDTEFSSVECLLTPFKDEFPVLRSYGPLLSFAVCALMCVFGMPMASQGGLYILTVMDTYLGGIPAPLDRPRRAPGRLRRFCTDIEFMTGDQPGLALKICWAVFCPLCLTWIVIADLFLYGEPLTLGEYMFPTWVNVVGTCAVLVAVEIIAAFALYHLRSCGYDLHRALLPSYNWGPKDPTERREYVRFLQERGMGRSTEQEPKLARPPSLGEGAESGAILPQSSTTASHDRPASLAEAAATPLSNNAPAKA